MPRASVTIAGRAAVISSFPSRRRSVRLVAASARPFRGRMDTTTGPFRFGCGASGRTAVARARSRRRRLAEGTMQRADDVANFGARQGIENILSLTPGFNQSVGAQPRQLLRDRRLTQAEHILNLGHRLFPDEQTEDQEPSFVRQGFQEPAGLMRTVNHCVEVKMVFARRRRGARFHRSAVAHAFIFRRMPHKAPVRRECNPVTSPPGTRKGDAAGSLIGTLHPMTGA